MTLKSIINHSLSVAALSLLALPVSSVESNTASTPLNAASKAKQPNIIFILTDDQRFDELGVMNKALKTPNMDKMANEGVHFKNAFVTTSLCSPSRATILTGQYMRSHGVVDNNVPIKKGTKFFPQYMQKEGYQTAFIGKWHMGGHHDDPQPGFDYWLSFKGQGHYVPQKDRNGKVNTFNINGKHVPQKGYITDELTDYAVDWLENRDKKKPFFMYLSHKAVHANFTPAERHKNLFADKLPVLPKSAKLTKENAEGKPMWVHNQRNSWHGIDFPYHSDLDIRQFKRQYDRTITAVDDSIGRVNNWLAEQGLAEDTIVILMGDNGFMFGEHGLIDKRNAYEESMRVPLLMYAPGRIKGGTKVEEVVANLDIAPTMLKWAGADRPKQFQGESLVDLAEGKPVAKWRQNFMYEYFWEYNFPSTPTTFAVRTPKFKLIQYHGIWDIEELYDIVNDPKEMTNLIDHPDYVDVKVKLRKELFELLKNDRGENAVNYTARKSSGSVFRHKDRSKASPFHQRWMRTGADPDVRQQFKADSKKKVKEMGTITAPKKPKFEDPSVE